MTPWYCRKTKRSRRPSLHARVYLPDHHTGHGRTPWQRRALKKFHLFRDLQGMQRLVHIQSRVQPIHRRLGRVFESSGSRTSSCIVVALWDDMLPSCARMAVTYTFAALVFGSWLTCPYMAKRKSIQFQSRAAEEPSGTRNTECRLPRSKPMKSGSIGEDR